MKNIQSYWKKTCLLLLFTLCFFQNIHSQRDFRKGYIITNKKDTLPGLIDYRESYKKFTLCDFKPSKNSDIVTYFPNQIQGYGFQNGAYFESKGMPTVNNTIEKVFIEVLVRGKATLYKLKGTFFLRKNDSILHKLDNKRQAVISANGKKTTKNAKRYIGVLKYLLADCSSVKGKVERTLYGEKSLTRLIEKYNSCSNEASISFKAGKRWFQMHVGVSLGMNSSSITLTPKLLSEIRNFSGNFSNDNSISPALFLNFSFPRVYERISFYTEVSYLSASYSAFDVITFGNITERNDIEITLKQIKIPVGLRYTFPKKFITPYFAAGISTIITTESNSNWSIEREANNIVQTIEGLPLVLDETRVGFWGSVGMNKPITNKLNSFIEVRYTSSSGKVYNSFGSSILYNLPNIKLLIGLSF